MENYFRESEEVLYTNRANSVINKELIEELKLMAISNRRERLRLCMHSSKDSPLHEMLILHTNNCYVRPHCHLINSESITVLEGEADLVIFNEDGVINFSVPLGGYDSGRCCYFKIEPKVFHTIIIKSNFLVFQEVTLGPFNRSNLINPIWAPADDSENSHIYLESIKKQLLK
jgi:cupin fold WbuC family metalloprotein